MKEERKLYFFEQYYSLQFFAEDSPTGEKTEEATPRQKRRARERGDIPKSQDIISAIVLLFSLLYFYIMGKRFFEDLYLLIVSTYREASVSENLKVFSYIYLKIAILFLKIVGPFLLLVFLAAVIANLGQVGFVFTLYPLKPDIGRLNPVSGLKKMFSFHSLNELWKALFKLVILFYIPYQVIRKSGGVFSKFLQAPFGWAIVEIFSLAFEIALKIVIVFLIIAIVDYMIQRYQWSKRLRMSKYEVKKEYEETEGKPQVKQEMRKRQMKMLMNQMMKAVPEADVVITNPTHIAVALKYDYGWPSPRVLAKGEGMVAQKIKEIAKEHNVPIVEDKPLARALYKLVKVGDFLPTEKEYEDLLIAVAKILASLDKVKERLGRL